MHSYNTGCILTVFETIHKALGFLPEEHFIDSSLSSLQILTFTAALEKKFHVTVPCSVMESWHSLTDVYNYFVPFYR